MNKIKLREYEPLTDHDRERIQEILAPLRTLSPARQKIIGRAIVATAKATARALVELGDLDRREAEEALQQERKTDDPAKVDY